MLLRSNATFATKASVAQLSVKSMVPPGEVVPPTGQFIGLEGAWLPPSEWRSRRPRAHLRSGNDLCVRARYSAVLAQTPNMAPRMLTCSFRPGESPAR
jgi:hypothetical protein